MVDPVNVYILCHPITQKKGSQSKQETRTSPTNSIHILLDRHVCTYNVHYFPFFHILFFLFLLFLPRGKRKGCIGRRAGAASRRISTLCMGRHRRLMSRRAAWDGHLPLKATSCLCTTLSPSWLRRRGHVSSLLRMPCILFRLSSSSAPLLFGSSLIQVNNIMVQESQFSLLFS